MKPAAPALLAASLLALTPVGACAVGGAPDGENAKGQRSPLDPGSIDMADFMIPSCDHGASAWQIGSEQFRVVPMGVSGGEGRFVIVKSADGSGYEDWTVDQDWMRIRADTTWAYEIPGGTWCDVQCGVNDAGSCQQRWNTNPSDPRNGLHPTSPWAYTVYSDPADPSRGAPITPRTMPLPQGGSYQFTSSIVISGARRDTCATCGVNFDSKGQAVGRSVTATRYASWQGFQDVVQLHIDSGPGAGEDYFYARGKGWVGFNGAVASAEIASSTPPQMLCGGAQPASICSVTGQPGSPPPSPPPQPTQPAPPSPPPPPPPPGTCPCLSGVNNYCLYPKGTPGCAMLAPGGYCDPNGDGNFNDADWVRGYNEYKTSCGGSQPPPPPPPPPPSCACKSGVNNFCLYPPSTPGCAMTAPFGYCDPNGDGNFSDADWVRGYSEYHQQCP